MLTQFEWDQNKAKKNLRNHNVDFDEAQTVFTDDYSVVIPAPDHSREEERWIIIGISRKNRLLLVVFTQRMNVIRLISARKATPRERKKYEEDLS